tara:strand:- start:10707 stop:11108 length:402 start_codon:yes stop_codon:yes gene_type:complete
LSKKSIYKKLMSESAFVSLPNDPSILLGKIMHPDGFRKQQTINELAWSSIEARDQVESDMKRISKVLGKASQQTIKIMMDGVKGGRYDAMDISKSIETGPAKLAHDGEREFMKVLWAKVRDGFRRYSVRRKLR